MDILKIDISKKDILQIRRFIDRAHFFWADNFIDREEFS